MALRQDASKHLADHLGISEDTVTTQIQGPSELAFMASVGPHRFSVVFAASGAAAPTSLAIHRARSLRQKDPQALPVVVVPYMGPLGAAMCREAGVGWLDLSGNADIRGPGLRIHVEGRPNKHKRPGRPSTAFAPKSSRIARRLLAHPDSHFTQSELARACRLDQGFTSRVVRKLETDGLVQRSLGKVKVHDPDLLLDAWAESYDFSRHQIIRGHVPARTSDELVETLAGAFEKEKSKHALTGLSAAWRMDAFAEFRLVSFYVEHVPSKSLLESLNFREESRGANVWLVVPNDDGAFDEGSHHSGVLCAHPVQVYLDLAGHPERSKDAALHLRSTHLQWGKGA